MIAPSNDENLGEVLQRGCWTPVARVGERAPKKPVDSDTGDLWNIGGTPGDGTQFDVMLNGETQGRIHWPLLGRHNQHNALGAIAAARHAGVPPAAAIDALNQFRGVKRRLEVLFENDHFVLYDDFAHHPTAIRSTLEGLRKRVASDEILAVVEPRTHTMSLGTLRSELATCCAAADRVIWFRGENIKWDLAEIVQGCVVPATLYDNHDTLVAALEQEYRSRGGGKRLHVVIMSNGAFGGIYRKLLERL